VIIVLEFHTVKAYQFLAFLTVDLHHFICVKRTMLRIVAQDTLFILFAHLLSSGQYLMLPCLV